MCAVPLRLVFVFTLGAALTACQGPRGRGPAPVPDAGGGECGDDSIDPGELCDGADLGGSTCEDFRFTGGVLGCAESCREFDFAMCEGESGECGNDTAEAGEVCDGTDLGGESCESRGLGGGTLSCAMNCQSYDTSACGVVMMNAPQILTFTTNVTSITEGESVVFSLVATDPDGVDDIIGGTLNDPGTGMSYGTLATAASEGAYTLTLSWGDIDRVRSIDFADLETRTFEAEIFDVAGQRGVGTVDVTLTCDGDSACSGTCSALDSELHCGACGTACDGGSLCSDEGSGFVCSCPAGQVRCGTACVTLDSDMHCGACGNTCLGGGFCQDTGGSFACGCTGAGESYCAGAGCLVPITDAHCGGCGMACAADESCTDARGTIECLPAPSMNAPGAGQLVITELMANPDDVTDAEGEWIELYNPSASSTYDLRGCSLADASASVHFFFTSVTIAPRARITLAKSSSPGFVPDATFSGVSLNNAGDDVIIRCGSVTVDAVTYGLVSVGRSRELSENHRTASQNDSESNWCDATRTYNVSDQGTPGTANDCRR